MSAEFMDNKSGVGGSEEVDLMDELLDSGENFDELNDVTDEKSNKRKNNSSKNMDGNRVSQRSNSDMSHHSRQSSSGLRMGDSNRNGGMGEEEEDDEDEEEAEQKGRGDDERGKGHSSNGSSTENHKRIKLKDDRTSPVKSPKIKSAKKSLDELTDEDELMDYDETSRPSSVASNTREPSISDDSRVSSRASSHTHHSSEKDEDDKIKPDVEDENKTEEKSVSEKRKISMEEEPQSRKESIEESDGKDAPKDGVAAPGKKKYDYITKINYLFRDARFFLMKSNNEENISLSKNKGVWSTPPQNEAKLNHAVKECRNVILIYSVKESGRFCGFARVAGESRRDLPAVNWILPQGLTARALGGVYTLDWISKKDLAFNKTLHLYNPWNEGKSVKIGRDGQEIEPRVAEEICRLFPKDETVSLTSALLRSKKRAKALSSSGVTRGPIRRPLVMPGDRRAAPGGGGGRGGAGFDHYGSGYRGRGRGGGNDGYYGGGRRGFGDRRGRGRPMYLHQRGGGRADFNRGGGRGGRGYSSNSYNSYSSASGASYSNSVSSGSAAGGVRRKRYDNEDDYDEGTAVHRNKRQRRDEEDGYTSRGRSDRSTSPYRGSGSTSSAVTGGTSSSSSLRRSSDHHHHHTYGSGGSTSTSTAQTAYNTPPPPPKIHPVHLSYQDFMMREMSRDYSSRSSSSTLPPMAFPPPPPFAPISPPRYYDPPPMPEYAVVSSSSSSRSRSASTTEKTHSSRSTTDVTKSYDRSVDEFLLRNRDRRREDSRERRYRERR